jgi:hypothetical protein
MKTSKKKKLQVKSFGGVGGRKKEKKNVEREVGGTKMAIRDQ